ncbi:MAG TPA: aliphatic sulfonate ABC transporter substrate-binding protein [Microcoleaceae cyanobacterium]|jgi:sulfonate transport system substrate-binding protein
MINHHYRFFNRLPIWLISITLIFCVSILNACSPNQPTADRPDTIRLDYAYYNPVSLVLKEKGWLEDELKPDNVKVEWVLSQGSNKALEFLNARSLDFGSTAGAAALIGKANGNPIKSIYVYSKPEWTALVTRADSPIKTVAELKGKKVAVTRGTDPYIFLLRSLDQVGLSEKDIELVQLQHADGRTALEKGDVDAWAGLDPHMAKTEVEKGAKLFFRNPNFNSYGVLNVRDEFAQKYPNYVERVLVTYERARQWAQQNPADLKQVLVRESKLTDAVATKQLERTNLSNAQIGDNQKQVILAAGKVLKKSGVIKENVDVEQTVATLIDPQFITKVASR